MQKFASKYGTAAHLALLTVAPLFLLPYFTIAEVGHFIIWLSVVSLFWVFLGPSRRSGETTMDSRYRVLDGVVRDPLFWFSVAVAFFAWIQWLNSGIRIAYDAAAQTWSIAKPALENIPGSAGDSGFLPMAASLAMIVLFTGIRHSLGRQARMSYAVMASILSGVAAIVAVLALNFGAAGPNWMLLCDYRVPSFIGTTFGLFFLGSLVALFGAVEFSWVRGELLLVIALSANALGLVAFAPAATVLVFFAAFILIMLISFVLTRRLMSGPGSFRCALAIVLAVGTIVFFTVTAAKTSPVGMRVQSALALFPFPDNFFKLRAALSSLSFTIWKSSPWDGTGLGSFPLDLRFYATAADWAIIDPAQKAVLSAWWQLLVERGITGGVMFAVGFAFLLWSYFYRLIRSFKRISWHPLHILGPFALLAMVAISFVDCSLLRADVLVTLVAFLALSAADFPAPLPRTEEAGDAGETSHTQSKKKEDENGR